MNLLTRSHIDWPSLAEAVALNESNRKMGKEDSIMRLTDFLFGVPTAVLSNDHLTLDELMVEGNTQTERRWM
eukprot:6412546-Ditylum_brightwellii.AAC.1